MKYWVVIASALALCGCAEFPDVGCVSDSECRLDRVCLANACTAPVVIGDGDVPDDQDPVGELPDPGAFTAFVYEIAEEPAAGSGRCDCDEGDGFRYIVFAFEDGRADLFYEEGFLGHGFNPWSEFGGPETRRLIETEWEVSGAQIRFGEWLTCDLSDDGVSMACVAERAVVSAGVEGAEVGLRLDGFAGFFPENRDDPAYDAYAPVD